jgi:hypothetical protein
MTPFYCGWHFLSVDLENKKQQFIGSSCLFHISTGKFNASMTPARLSSRLTVNYFVWKIKNTTPPVVN